MATSLANAAAAAIAAAQQSQPNPCVTQNSDSITCVVPSSLHGTSAGQNVNKQHPDNTPKRLHVSNIPFRFRDPDLRNMFGVSIFMFFFCVIFVMYSVPNVISHLSKTQSWPILNFTFQHFLKWPKLQILFFEIGCIDVLGNFESQKSGFSNLAKIILLFQRTL